jgi:hypothetical protein
MKNLFIHNYINKWVIKLFNIDNFLFTENIVYSERLFSDYRCLYYDVIIKCTYEGRHSYEILAIGNHTKGDQATFVDRSTTICGGYGKNNEILYPTIDSALIAAYSVVYSENINLKTSKIRELKLNILLNKTFLKNKIE